MIEFIKEAGMAVLWLMLGYLVGERNAGKDKSDD
ncbi:phage protein [Streptococcus suis]|nr:phage protein [Streptococcus suis]